MPHIFVEDGAPDAAEYMSNYIYIDEDNAQSVERALALLRTRTDARPAADAWKQTHAARSASQP